mgnify:CR=1 FL=1
MHAVQQLDVRIVDHAHSRLQLRNVHHYHGEEGLEHADRDDIERFHNEEHRCELLAVDESIYEEGVEQVTHRYVDDLTPQVRVEVNEEYDGHHSDVDLCDVRPVIGEQCHGETLRRFNEYRVVGVFSPPVNGDI